MTVEQFLIQNQWLLWLIIFWCLPWKGVALWKAARNAQKWWFGVLFVVNTLSVLDILYIFYFSRKKIQKEIKTR